MVYSFLVKKNSLHIYAAISDLSPALPDLSLGLCADSGGAGQTCARREVPPVQGPGGQEPGGAGRHEGAAGGPPGVLGDDLHPGDGPSVCPLVLAMTAPGGRRQLQVCGFGRAGDKQLGADTARGQDGGEGG